MYAIRYWVYGHAYTQSGFPDMYSAKEYIKGVPYSAVSYYVVRPNGVWDRTSSHVFPRYTSVSGGSPCYMDGGVM